MMVWPRYPLLDFVSKARLTSFFSVSIFSRPSAKVTWRSMGTGRSSNSMSFARSFSASWPGLPTVAERYIHWVAVFVLAERVDLVDNDGPDVAEVLAGPERVVDTFVGADDDVGTGVKAAAL